MIRLAGHAALVTGSSQGVGRAIALALAEAGADVVVHGLTQDALGQQTVEECRARGVQAALIEGDLAGPTEPCVDHVFRQALQANPKIDILVSNAGTYREGPFLEMDYATFEYTMRLNVFSHFFLVQRFARHWVAQRVPGRVLLIGSINGRLAEPNHTAYDTSKGAIEAMVKTLCVALAPLGIRVNGLAPGLFVTPLTAPALADPRLRSWMELHTPNGKVPGPEVCGAAAVFLVSDAADHIHGQMLLVDGGMSAWQQPDPPAHW
ncbi:MAG: gluconate 5-dehydrogenase [Pirellulaceae bacterium]|nr:MAG: gluconate 5-dehydrogenase [Pirellulaceae bacterium]